MALAKKSSNSTRLVIIGVVIIVVAGIGFLLYREFFLNADGSGGDTSGVTGGKRVITDFHESVLNDPRYTTLKSYDETISANANTDGGQANPFQ